MNISIIHPSRNRPEMAFEVANKWTKNAQNDLQYIISIDTTEPQLKKYQSLFSQFSLFSLDDDTELLISDNQSAIEAVNNGAKKSKNDLLIVVSDDFDCFPGWDVWLLENLNGKEDYIVKTYDGIQEKLITLPIMDRKYYERFGYIYYPEYKHMFCDTEMTDVGHILNKVVNLNDPNHPFIHKHYTAGLMQKDEINEKNDATWNQGETLYYSRKEMNFGL